MRRRRKILLLIFMLAPIYLGAIVVAGISAVPASSDIAVVLGNEVLANGKPSARLAARLDCAVDAYRRHLAPLIMTSGGIGKSGYDEAEVMAQYLMAHGVPQKDIIKDSAGVNTMATAVNTARIANLRHLKRILIVSQYYHLPRCLLAFHKAGLQSLTADYPRYFEVGDLMAIAREGIALPVYFLK